MQTLDPDIRGRLAAARLPVLPQVLLRIMAHCESEDAGIASLAELLSSDPALSARVLQIATSSAYYRGARPVSLERALATIGMNMLRTLLITESVYQSFSQLLPDRVDLRGFWKHSLGTAIAARELAGRLGYPHADEAYLAGLLHDIGRLALLSAAPAEYIVNFFHTDDLGLCAVEERTLRTTHADVGAWVVERFGLDSFMADAILYHHEPLPRLHDAHPLVRCVALADLVVHYESDDDFERMAAHASILPQELQAIHHTVMREVVRIADCLGIDLTDSEKLVPPPETERRSMREDEAAALLRRQMRDMTLVSHAAQVFNRGDNRNNTRDDCAGAITDAAMVVFELQAGLTMTSDQGRGMFVAHAPRGAGQRIEGFAIPLTGDGPLATAARKNQIAHITHAAAASIGETQLLRFFAADRLVGVPLATGGQCHGMLVAAVPDEHMPALAQREPMLRAFGSQAGAALAALAGPVATESASAEFRLASRKMAHEVSNPLSIIRNYLAVLERKIGDDKGVDNELGILSEEIDRIDQLVRRFANPETGPMEQSVAVNACVRHVVQLFRASESLRASIEITCAESPQEVIAAMDRHSLQQILVNLVKNAIEAMPAGGRISVRHHGEVRRNGSPFTRLEIVDNGPGIPAGKQGVLFQRGGSTKSGQRGFGLTIVHELVAKCGGTIVFHSDANGTRFEIVLPAVPSATAAGQPAHQPTQDGG